MAKETKGIVVKISQEFDLKLRKHIINLEETGTHTTKSNLIVKLAERGYRFL